MGLFDKKYCDICGEKIGLLGNRKLADGNMCKNCAKKLSPFCDDRKSSNLEHIKKHLEYREENKKTLQNFHPDIILGDNKKVYIDRQMGAFVMTGFNPNSWDEENPDVIPLSQIRSCDLDIDEDRDEIYYRNEEGERVSYNPPRYEFYYNFNLNFIVDNPFFDDFTMRLNNFRVKGGIGTIEYNKYQNMAMEIINTLMPGRMGGMNQGYQNPSFVQQNNYNSPMGMFGAGSNNYAPPQQQYVRENNFRQNSQNTIWVCPSCGSQNSGKFCMNCGAPQTAVQRPSKIIRCDKCGWTSPDLNNTPKFCPQCGDPIDFNDIG